MTQSSRRSSEPKQTTRWLAIFVISLSVTTYTALVYGDLNMQTLNFPNRQSVPNNAGSYLVVDNSQTDTNKVADIRDSARLGPPSPTSEFARSTITRTGTLGATSTVPSSSAGAHAVTGSSHRPTRTTSPSIAPIHVGQSPHGVGVNSATNMVYVANAGDGTVSVISGTTNAISASISVGLDPVAVGVNSATNMVYVANAGDGTVSVISGSTNSVVATVSVGINPSGVGVNSATNMVYVANAGDGTVSVISGSTNAVMATIRVGSKPSGVDAATNIIYVANAGDGTVSQINGANNAISATIQVGINPSGVGVNSATHTVYVANAGDGTVSAIFVGGNGGGTAESIDKLSLLTPYFALGLASLVAVIVTIVLVGRKSRKG